MSRTGVFVLIGVLGALEGRAQTDADERIAALEHTVSTLQAELARLQATAPGAPADADIQARVAALEDEIERLTTGGAGGAAHMKSMMGFAPAASKVYGVKRGLALGGYGELLYEDPEATREDGAASGRSNQVDMVRQNLYLGYRFDDRILFNSEIEFEHGNTARGGEVSVEMAYLDFRPRKALGFRAGVVLVPMGLTNELHEPPIFFGARRPEVETALLPSTWREAGAGVFGESGPVQWRTYVVAGLNSAGFSAAGIRGGRQVGARSRAEDWAWTGRIDVTPAAALLAGGSFFVGGSGQGAAQGGETIDGRVSVIEAHAQYQARGLQLRALAARTHIGDAALINARNNLAGARSIGERQYGWYVEAGYTITSFARLRSWSIAPFVRYERLDTQQRVPAGFARDGANRRRLLTAGLSIKPLFNVVLKLDYQRQRTDARTGVNQVNAGMGFLF